MAKSDIIEKRYKEFFILDLEKLKKIVEVLESFYELKETESKYIIQYTISDPLSKNWTEVS